MVKKIFKYELKVIAKQTLELPKDASIFGYLQVQNNLPVLWAVVDATEPIKTYTIEMRGTGWDFDIEPIDFLGTVQIGGLVWHYFITEIK